MYIISKLYFRCTGQIGGDQCKREASGADILPPVATGKITTKNKFSFKFGRVEVKAKMPAGSWLIPGAFRTSLMAGIYLK